MLTTTFQAHLCGKWASHGEASSTHFIPLSGIYPTLPVYCFGCKAKESDSKLSSISKLGLALCILAKLNNLTNVHHIFYRSCLFQTKMQVYSFLSLYVLVFDICCVAFPASNPFNYVKIWIFLCRVISPKLSIHLFWVVLIQYPSYWMQKSQEPNHLNEAQIWELCWGLEKEVCSVS